MEQFVADEVEDKSMLSLHRVAEEFATRKSYAEMGIISNRNWKIHINHIESLIAHLIHTVSASWSRLEINTAM